MTDEHAPGLTARPSATGKSRIVALDGLRAVALLIIMGYHFGVGWLQGGFFSLDIFYVLSGYLITGLLLSEYRKRDAIKLSAFWLRRARRLLPALLIVLVAVTLMVRFAEPAGLYPDFRISALSALFYFSNWWQIAAQSNYFFATGPVYPLTHTWSLAVEEQFYLVWPLVVLAVMTLSRTFTKGLRNLLVVSAIGAVASAVEMALLYGSGTKNTTRLYFGTDTHAQSILIGAVLACTLTVIQGRRGSEGMAPAATSPALRRLLTVVGVAGLAGTLTLTITQKGATGLAFRGGFALSALSAAAIIIGSVCVPAGPMGRVLSLRPLVWMGTVSYGAYLWHYPVFIYLDAARTGQTGLALLAIRFAVTFSLAGLSFYLVERPVMEGTFWRSLRAVGPAVALTGVTVVVIVAGTASEASAEMATVTVLPRTALAGAHVVPVLVAGDSTALTLGLVMAYPPDDTTYGVEIIDKGLEGCGVAEGPTIEIDGVTDAVPLACNSGAPPADQWPALLAQSLRQYRPRVVVLVAGRWEVYNRADLAGHVTNITHPAYARYVKEQIQRFVNIATSAGSQVVLMTAPYYDSGELPDGQPKPEDDPVRVRDFNKLVRSVAESNPGTVSVINLNGLVSPHGRYAGTIDGVIVRTPDGVHFTMSGWYPKQHAPDTLAEVQQFARWIDPDILPGIVGAAHRPIRR
jgi:peptidoglycan/LPS O-acetylase OafA/YrhL